MPINQVKYDSSDATGGGLYNMLHMIYTNVTLAHLKQESLVRFRLIKH